MNNAQEKSIIDCSYCKFIYTIESTYNSNNPMRKHTFSEGTMGRLETKEGFNTLNTPYHFFINVLCSRRTNEPKIQDQTAFKKTFDNALIYSFDPTNAYTMRRDYTDIYTLNQSAIKHFIPHIHWQTPTSKQKPIMYYEEKKTTRTSG